MNSPKSYSILEMKIDPHYPEEINKQIDYLKILDEIEWEQEYPIFYMCECKCGREVIRERKTIVRSKGFKSCGCYRNEFAKLGIANMKHGNGKRKNGKQDKLYKTWVSMRQRCNNPNNSIYKHYGGKGIKVCKEWNNYETFHKWAKKNGYKKNLTIERKDNSKGYSPDNCRWATFSEQARNRSHNSYFIINGERIILQDLANKLNLDAKLVRRMALDGNLRYEYWNKDPNNKN